MTSWRVTTDGGLRLRTGRNLPMLSGYIAEVLLQCQRVWVRQLDQPEIVVEYDLHESGDRLTCAGRNIAVRATEHASPCPVPAWAEDLFDLTKQHI